MNRRFFLGLALAVFAAGCSPKKDANELVVGMDLTYPPFETIDEAGKPRGISVDLAKALADGMGKMLRIENIPFTGLIPSLQTGRIDCIISSMTDTPERRESLAFSDPYLTTGLALLAGKNAGIQSIADADQPDKTIVVRQGTTGEVWARANIRQAKILAVDKESAAALEVVQGKAVAFIYDQMSVWQHAKQHPESTVALLAPIRVEQWAVGLRTDDTALRDEINRVLKSFRESGGFDALGDKYLSEQKKAFAAQGVPFVF